MGQITATRNLVAIKVVRLAGQLYTDYSYGKQPLVWQYMIAALFYVGCPNDFRAFAQFIQW